jgi:hypothetical protein
MGLMIVVGLAWFCVAQTREMKGEHRWREVHLVVSSLRLSNSHNTSPPGANNNNPTTISTYSLKQTTAAPTTIFPMVLITLAPVPQQQ